MKGKRLYYKTSNNKEYYFCECPPWEQNDASKTFVWLIYIEYLQALLQLQGRRKDPLQSCLYWVKL